MEKTQYDFNKDNMDIYKSVMPFDSGAESNFTPTVFSLARGVIENATYKKEADLIATMEMTRLINEFYNGKKGTEKIPKKKHSEIVKKAVEIGRKSAAKAVTALDLPPETIFTGRPLTTGEKIEVRNIGLKIDHIKSQNEIIRNKSFEDGEHELKVMSFFDEQDQIFKIIAGCITGWKNLFSLPDYKEVAYEKETAIQTFLSFPDQLLESIRAHILQISGMNGIEARILD